MQHVFLTLRSLHALRATETTSCIHSGRSTQELSYCIIGG